MIYVAVSGGLCQADIRNCGFRRHRLAALGTALYYATRLVRDRRLWMPSRAAVGRVLRKHFA